MLRHRMLPLLAAALLLPIAADAQEAGPTLDLEACIQQAIRQSTTLARAHRSVVTSGIQVAQATNALLPTVGLGAGFSRYTSVSPQRLLNPATNQIVEGSSTANTSMTYSTGVSLSQSLYSPSMIALYSQAEAQQQSAVAGEELQRQQLVLDVFQSYYGLLRSQRNLQVADTDVAYNQGLLRNVQALFDMGDRSQVDVLRQQNALAQAEQRQIAARNGVAKARADLLFVMGEDPTGGLQVVDDLEYVPREVTADDEFQRALDSHPMLEQSRLGIAAGLASVAAARAGRLPSVNLQGNYSWRGDNYLHLPDAVSKDYTWSMSVSLSVPVFDAFRTRNTVRRAQVELEGARQDESNAERSVRRDVNRALLDLDESRQSLQTARRSVTLAEEALRLSRELYRLGSGSLLEVNASQLDLVNAQYQEVQALFNLKIASAALDFATGVLY